MRRLAQDGQIDVQQHLLVAGGRRAVVPRHHDQRMHAISRAAIDASGTQRRASPVGTALLVVRPADLVDRVVEPQRQFHLVRILRHHLKPREVAQAGLQMLGAVVLAVWLRPVREQLAKQRRIGLCHAEALPHPVPGRLVAGSFGLRHQPFTQASLCCHSSAARARSWPRLLGVRWRHLS